MKTFKLLFIAATCCTILSCDKEFLEAKPDKALLVPTTAKEIQALLDNNGVIINLTPALPEISSDDFYITDAGYGALFTELERTTYIWSDQKQQVATVTDWETPYKQVFYANVALKAAEKLQPGKTSEAEINALKGSALFIRAYAHFNLLQAFAAPYEKSTAGNLPGVPVRLSSNVNDRPGRGTVQQAYDQVINDITAAEKLLPVQTAYKTRPSKTAANALLARVYLAMENYDKAGEYAAASLELNNKLIDYNSLNPAAPRPLPPSLPNGNDEVIYFSRNTVFSYFTSAATTVEPALHNSYAANDLRKAVFFNNRGNGVINFRGGYNGNGDVFSGLATDEMYLIRSESFARQGKAPDALKDLNTLLEKRWKTGTFVPFTAANAEEALKLILAERRKELL
ncbi:MAG TPA: RagB/SusD family nutrient uptake outer membrane protein, partial [Sphingobacteriaceae bacterium]